MDISKALRWLLILLLLNITFFFGHVSPVKPCPPPPATVKPCPPPPATVKPCPPPPATVKPCPPPPATVKPCPPPPATVKPCPPPPATVKPCPPPPATVKPCPPPPTKQATIKCPRDTLKFGVCGSWLGLVHEVIGTPPSKECCSLVKGLADLQAAVCFCTALKTSLLGVTPVKIPVALTLLLNSCGKNVPQGFVC